MGSQIIRSHYFWQFLSKKVLIKKIKQVYKPVNYEKSLDSRNSFNKWSQTGNKILNVR